MNELTPIPEPNPGVNQHCARWFAEEVQPHESALKSWLRFRFPWLQEVDDIAQEAVVRLWRRHNNPAGAPIKSAKAVLFVIARNAAIDEARHRAVVDVRSVTETEGLSVLDERADVAAIVDARQELDFFAEALRGLPARCRQVVTLTKVYGLTEREVAERLGISENTVRTQVVRGMERCTNYLRERGVNRKRHARR
ncbi:MAG: RNA polymerase sigma factor [Opitutaceae bacterium]